MAKARDKDSKVILAKLRKMHGEPRIELRYSNALELMVAAILAAQCTDERVNKVTESLFKKYRAAREYLQVKDAELEDDIKSTGFFRNKARSIKNFAADVEQRFGGCVPEDVETLTTIKGVGRKTANMVAGLAFGKPAIIVDTHVIRVSKRLGLTGMMTRRRSRWICESSYPRRRGPIFHCSSRSTGDTRVTPAHLIARAAFCSRSVTFFKQGPEPRVPGPGARVQNESEKLRISGQGINSLDLTRSLICNNRN